MKTKILSILALLLTVTQGAWAQHQPSGHFDSAVGHQGSISVSGWGWDQDQPNTSISVHVYVFKNKNGDLNPSPSNSNVLTSLNILANNYRSDIISVTGDNGNHGFALTFEVNATPGDYYVCAYGIDNTDGNILLNGVGEDITILAPFTVSYNANGGNGAPSAQEKRYDITLTLSSTQPTRDGYTFAGWATSADGAVAYAAGATYTANADVTLYAQWTPTYTATFAAGNDNTGWTIAPTSDVEGATVTVSYTGENKVKSVKVKAIPTVTLSKTAFDFDADYYKGSTQTFTVTRDGDGAITATSSNTDVATVSVDGNTVTVTRKYPGEGSAVITVSVAATESYAAAANQTVNVTFSSMSRHLGGVEAKNKGWFLGADGYVYPSIAAATNADTEARAVIAHVGAIEKYCDHAICLALEDAAAGAVVWSNATSAAQSWAASHAVSLGGTNYNTSHTSYDWVQNSTSVSSQTRNEGIGYGWRIPSVTDWRYIMQAFGGPSATSPVGVQTGVYGTTVRSAINTACGNSGLNSAAYWTCSTLTGSSPADYWGVHFQNVDNKDVFWTYQQSENPNLRLVFAY